MFTGIIETTGVVESLERKGSNINFCIESSISEELKVDQSVCHNGVCLTVTKVSDGQHWVTAIDESLKRSNLGDLIKGSIVNLERCMPANGRFDGHIFHNSII